MENKFKTGDKVHLISGSPNMTVREYVKGLVQCDWFANGAFEQRSFHEDQLEEYKPPHISVSTGNYNKHRW